MDDLVKKARQFATEQHQRIDQRRKYSNHPYDVHLKAVADIVMCNQGRTNPTARNSLISIPKAIFFFGLESPF
jgi:hypothetical protein